MTLFSQMYSPLSLTLQKWLSQPSWSVSSLCKERGDSIERINDSVWIQNNCRPWPCDSELLKQCGELQKRDETMYTNNTLRVQTGARVSAPSFIYYDDSCRNTGSPRTLLATYLQDGDAVTVNSLIARCAVNQATTSDPPVSSRGHRGSAHPDCLSRPTGPQVHRKSFSK